MWRPWTNVKMRFLCFRPETPFLGKFGPKNQNSLFKLKFRTYTNLNIQNSMVMFTFSAFDQKSLFWVNLVQKITIVSLSWNLVPKLIQICRIQCSPFLLLARNNPVGTNLVQKNQDCQFKLKFGTKTNWNMQNSMVVSSFSIFDWKYPFWSNLIQKIKIASLSWNLVPRLIQVCRIQWWWSLFQFSTGNILFG